MLRRTALFLKISKVSIPSTIKSLSYTHNYRRGIDYNLGKKFSSVTEKNRYEALSIIFEDKLDGYVGRRQYKMQCAGTLKDKIVVPLSKQGIDWHDLKALGRSELLDLCELLQLDSSTRTVFLAAIESKMCGVLTKSGKDRNPRTICSRPGRLQHGWRCGVNGHSHNTFFEGKPIASASALAASRDQGFLGLSAQQRALLLGSRAMGGGSDIPLRLPKGESSLNASHPLLSSNSGNKPKGEPEANTQPSNNEGAEGVEVRMENGIRVEHRRAPDFSIVGRQQDLQVLNPRIWATPNNPTFQVSVIGIELRVHPDDPRVGPQIMTAHKEWEMHGEAVRHVLWEMLELYGVERQPQHLDIEQGELGEPDSVFCFSSAFWGSAAADSNTNVGADENAIHPSEVAIERRMITEDGHSVPWFTPPLPQNFKGGVPQILPFSPTVIIRGVYRQVSEVVSAGDASGLEKRLHYPLLDISILKHPSACFWWSEEDEEKAIGHILSYAKRVPFALPFNLYLRVDPSRVLRRQFSAPTASEAKGSEKHEDTSTKSDSGLGPLSDPFASDFYLQLRERQRASLRYFDLANFRASAWLAATGGQPLDSEEYQEEDEVASPSRKVDKRAIFESESKAQSDDVRLPWEFDMEVSVQNSNQAAETIDEPAPFDQANGNKQDDTEHDDDEDLEDALFPKVNPKGWE